MKKPILGVAAAAGLVTALPAAAQFAKPEDAIKYRKAGMTLMAAHFGKFRSAMNKMHEEMAKLNATAKTGNLDQIKTAFGPTAKSCKACHDDFRKE